MSDLNEVLHSEAVPSEPEAEAKEPEPTEEVREPEPTPEVEATPEPEPEPQPEEPKQEQTVPLPTFLDMRDKAKRAEELERQLQELQRAQQQPQEAPPAPDMFEDPEGYRQFTDQRMQQALRQQQVSISRRFAMQSAGAEEFAEAEKWANENFRNNPALLATQQSEDPWGEMLKVYRQHKTLSEIGDADAYKEKVRAEIMAELQQQQPGQQPAKAAVIPSDFSKGQGGGSQHTSFAESDLDVLLS